MENKLLIRIGIFTAEPHYLGIKPLIIIEKYLEENSFYSTSLIDYKFICIDGKSISCFVCYDRNKDSVVYDLYKINP